MPLILMLGERPKESAPILTLAHGLGGLGFEIIFSDGAEYCSTKEWIRLCRQASLLIVVKYEYLDRFFVRQLAIAVSLGRPVVRWWVGSDVLNVLENLAIAESVRTNQSLFAKQIAVSPHLVRELKDVGIQAQYIPSVCDLDKTVTVLKNVPKSILVYLPTRRRDFYGAALIEEAIGECHDIEFVIVGDKEHSLATYPNVRSIGWVSEMDDIWDSVGGMVRITHHDGMPRMVLEALRRGKHVIYSWPFPGCILAKSKDELLQAILNLSKLTSVNMDGISLVQELLTPNPAEKFRDLLIEILKERKPTRRFRGIGVAVINTYRMKYR